MAKDEQATNTSKINIATLQQQLANRAGQIKRLKARLQAESAGSEEYKTIQNKIKDKEQEVAIREELRDQTATKKAPSIKAPPLRLVGADEIDDPRASEELQAESAARKLPSAQANYPALLRANEIDDPHDPIENPYKWIELNKNKRNRLSNLGRRVANGLGLGAGAIVAGLAGLTEAAQQLGRNIRSGASKGLFNLREKGAELKSQAGNKLSSLSEGFKSKTSGFGSLLASGASKGKDSAKTGLTSASEKIANLRNRANKSFGDKKSAAIGKLQNLRDGTEAYFKEETYSNFHWKAPAAVGIASGLLLGGASLCFFGATALTPIALVAAGASGTAYGYMRDRKIDQVPENIRTRGQAIMNRLGAGTVAATTLAVTAFLAQNAPEQICSPGDYLDSLSPATVSEPETVVTPTPTPIDPAFTGAVFNPTGWLDTDDVNDLVLAREAVEQARDAGVDSALVDAAAEKVKEGTRGIFTSEQSATTTFELADLQTNLRSDGIYSVEDNKGYLTEVLNSIIKHDITRSDVSVAPSERAAAINAMEISLR